MGIFVKEKLNDYRKVIRVSIITYIILVLGIIIAVLPAFAGNELKTDYSSSELAVIGGNVWFDSNGNGIQDSGEEPANEVMIRLYRSDGTVIDNTMADLKGYYNFKVPPGDYYLKYYTTKSPWELTLANQGTDDSLDNDATGEYESTETISLDPGEVDLSWDVGLIWYRGFMIDTLNDLNRDGTRDIGKEKDKIEEITIFKFYDNESTLLDLEITRDLYGHYHCSIPPGIEVSYIEVIAPPGFIFSPLDEMDTQWTGGNNVDPETGRIEVDYPPTSKYISYNVMMHTDEPLPIELTKSANRTLISAGESVTYTYNVQNNGDEPLSEIELSDDKCEPAYVDGDDGNGLLDPMETWTYENTDYIFYNTTNKAKVWGKDPEGNWVPSMAKAETVNVTYPEPPAVIGGEVWLDNNADGIQDPYEDEYDPGGGLNVYIYRSDGVLVDVKDARNSYNITVPPGEYYLVFEDIRHLWPTFTLPNQGDDDLLDSDALPQKQPTENISLNPGEIDLTWDIGISDRSSIGGMVWNDLNHNGIWNSNEPGIYGVILNFYDDHDKLIYSEVTSNKYLGYNYGLRIGPSVVYAEVVAPPGFMFSPQYQGNYEDDSNVDPISGRMKVRYQMDEGNYSYNVGMYESGPQVLNFSKFADRPLITIGEGVIYIYELGNEGDEPLYNVSITDDNFEPAYMHGDDGNNALDPGEVWVFEYPIDLNKYTETTATAWTENAEGSLILAYSSDKVQVAYDELMELGGRVWFDSNGNGIQDPNENPADMASILLYKNDGPLIECKKPDINGLYNFTVPPGNYRLRFDSMCGWKFTIPNQGDDNSLDSDALYDQLTEIIPLGLREAKVTWDVGILWYCPFENRVWNDLNKNGIREDGEPGLSGVTLNFYDSQHTLLKTGITETYGIISIELAPNTVYAEVVAPPNFKFSPQNQGDDDSLDSDVDPATGRMEIYCKGRGIYSQGIGIYEKETTEEGKLSISITPDRSVINSGELVNYTYKVENLGSKPLSDITVSDDKCGPVVYVSGDNGNERLYPGEIWIYESSVKLYENTTNTATVTGKDTCGNIVSAQASETVEVTCSELAEIGGQVWFDANGNGLQDSYENEKGWGVMVYLYDSSGTLINSTTPINAFYNFKVPAGDYYLEFEETMFAIPVFTSPNQGVDDSLDSDAVRGKPTEIISLKTGDVDLTWDVGMTYYCYIGDLIWNDLNHNGIQEVGEPGIPNVTLNIYDSQSRLIKTDVSNENGGYGVNIPPDTLYAEIIAPSGFVFSPQGMGEDDEYDSNVDPETGRMELYCSPDDMIFDYDIGMYLVEVDSAIEINKTADKKIVSPGETVIYTYKITNTGSVPLTNVSVTDDMYAGKIAYVSGDNCNKILDPGETWIYRCSIVIKIDPTNIGTVTALDPTGKTVQAEDSETVYVLSPDLSLEVKADKPIVPGETVNFSYELSNTGCRPFSEIMIKAGDCGNPAYISGDNGNNKLDSKETWKFQSSAVFEAAATKQVTAFGKNQCGELICAVASVEVELIRPALEVEITADKDVAAPGETVDFSIEVTNSGNVPLSNISVTSETCKNITYVSGDNCNDLLEPEENWLYQASIILESSTTDDIVENNMTVIGKDPAGNSIQALATASVEIENSGTSPANPGEDSGKSRSRGGGGGFIFMDETENNETNSSADQTSPENANPSEAAIQTKQPGNWQTAAESKLNSGISLVLSTDKQAVEPNENVAITCEIKNTGNSSLSEVSLTGFGTEEAAYQEGDKNDNGVLDPGETWFFEYSAKSNEDMENTVTASAKDEAGNVITAEASVDLNAAEKSIFSRLRTLVVSFLNTLFEDVNSGISNMLMGLKERAGT